MGPTTTAAGEALRSIAADTVHPVAQRVLAQNPSLADHLAGNHHLSDETFVRLYPNARIPVGRAKRLVARDGLTDAQFAHVLKVEKRASVLITALDDARLPDAWMDAMLDAPAFTRAVADRAVAAYGPALQAAWVRAAADKVGGLARLTVWLQEASSVTDEQVAAALADLRPWCASPAQDKHVKTAIVWLLATRPGAIAGAARSTDPRVRQLAAGCRHLTDPDDQLAAVGLADADGLDLGEWQMHALRALVWNPVVGNDMVHHVTPTLQALERDAGEPNVFHPAKRLRTHPVPVTVPYEELDDPVLLAWVLTRSLPRYGYDGDRFNAGRPWDLTAVLSNPHLTAMNLLHAHRRLVPDNGTAWHDPRVVEAFNTALAAHPVLVTDYGITPLQAPPDPQPAPARTRGVPHVGEELLDAAADQPATGLRWIRTGGNVPLLRYLERELDDADQTVWQVALSLADTHFTGTMADLVTVARATA